MKSTLKAAKKMILIILCVFLTGILSACELPKDAEPSAAELGIYAFGTTTISKKDQGHTFLTLKNTSDETIDFLNYPIVRERRSPWATGAAQASISTMTPSRT